MVEVITLWVVCSIAVSIAATDRGRGAWAWFALSLAISPLLSALLLLLMPREGSK